MKTYKLYQVVSDVKAVMRLSSDRSPATILRTVKDRLDALNGDGFKLDPDYNQSRAISFVVRCVETSPPFPTRFTHWRVWSERKNAILCAITKKAEVVPWTRPAKELGLFWEFQSPDSEFVYLPAVWPRDGEGKLVISGESREDLPDVVGYDRMENYRVLHNFRETHFKEAYSVKYHFKRAEAMAFVSLLKQIDRGTEDFDDSVYVEKYTPSLLQRLIEWGTGSVERI